MTEILVTGGAGQLATALGRAAPARVHIVGRPHFDFDRPDTLRALFEGGAPAVLINGAAWTAVDDAEDHEAEARRANAEGPALLAELCARHGTRLIHISTDYVFDGGKGAPYTEDDAVSPTGIYGATKLAGERAIQAACAQAVILRTAWVYATRGRNFVRTMLNAARARPRLTVVADQRGCPTNADDLAAAVLAVADGLLDGAPGGLYHAAGSGETTWHGLAEAIFEDAGPLGWPVPEVVAVRTADWPTRARRPADSRLDCTKLAEVFGVSLPPWRSSLTPAVTSICNAMAPA